jgi:hypothetical protein
MILVYSIHLVYFLHQLHVFMLNSSNRTLIYNASHRVQWGDDMEMKKIVLPYLFGLILMAIGFICYLYEGGEMRYWNPYPYQTMGAALVFIGICIMVTLVIVDALGWQKT